MCVNISGSFVCGVRLCFLSFVSETELKMVSFGGDDIPYGVVFAALSVLFHT